MTRRRTTTARGYGAQHQAMRKWWKPKVDAGIVDCHATICLIERDGHSRRIHPGQPWDLGHTPDKSAWTGPEHRRCNRSEGARRRLHRIRFRTTTNPQRHPL